MGDPAGVGPEVIAAVWRDSALHQGKKPFVVGRPEVMEWALGLFDQAVEVVSVDSVTELHDQLSKASTPDRLICLKTASTVGPLAADPAVGGQAAYEAIATAIDLALKDDCDAIVTAPISKARLQAAGHNYPGHTELLAEKCGVSNFAMMLYLPPTPALPCPAGLGVVHVTLHTALRNVFDELSIKAIAEKCGLADDALRAFGATPPRIGVAALNPHAGENGLFGNEEAELIRPAVEHAISSGLKAAGPIAADTLLLRASQGEFDAVVAMYHDQGHIALKLLGMHHAVNVTLGLPIVRTSVAHGTANDLVGTGKAETTGMLAAIKAATDLARQRKQAKA